MWIVRGNDRLLNVSGIIKTIMLTNNYFAARLEIVNKLYGVNYNSLSLQFVDDQLRQILQHIQQCRRKLKQNSYLSPFKNRIEKMLTHSHLTARGKKLTFNEWLCLTDSLDKSNVSALRKRYREYIYLLSVDYRAIRRLNCSEWHKRESNKLPKHIKAPEEFFNFLRVISIDIRDLEEQMSTSANTTTTKLQWVGNDSFYTAQELVILRNAYDDIVKINAHRILFLDMINDKVMIQQLRRDKVLDNWIKLVHPDKALAIDANVASLLSKKVLAMRML